MLWVSVGIGIVISLLFAEWLGLAAGGIVVPGYIALFWDKPLNIVSTLVAAGFALGFLKIISSYTFVYGRRRLVLTILLGFIFAYFIRYIVHLSLPNMPVSLDPIGYVIPGLMAYWMEKQGIIETVSTTVIASVMVRLMIILINAGAPINEVWF
jgi:gamma-polyglutamate biosynthesis protein CapC